LKRISGRWLCLAVVTTGLMGANGTAISQQQEATSVDETQRHRAIYHIELKKDKDRVVYNNLSSLSKDGQELPKRAIASRENKKIIWLNKNGTVEKEKIFPQLRLQNYLDDLQVSANGLFYIVKSGKFGYFKKNGELIWSESIGERVTLSPTGESAVGKHSEEPHRVVFVNAKGKIKEFNRVGGGFWHTFSEDGNFLFAAITDSPNDTGYVGLFNKNGDLLWETLHGKQSVTQFDAVAISKIGKYVSVAIHRGLINGQAISLLTVLDNSGKIVYQDEVVMIRKMAFSEETNQLGLLQYDYIDQKREVTIVDIETGAISAPLLEIIQDASTRFCFYFSNGIFHISKQYKNKTGGFFIENDIYNIDGTLVHRDKVISKFRKRWNVKYGDWIGENSGDDYRIYNFHQYREVK